MGEGGRRNSGEEVMVTGMLRELLVVATVLDEEEEEVRMIRLSGRFSALGLWGRWTMTGGVSLGLGEARPGEI